jgi:hypothetical protein
MRGFFMTIDLENDELIPLRQAAATEFPGKKRLSLATINRWIIPPGVRGAVLETVCVGRTRYTTRKCIAAFIAAQNPPAEPKAEVSPQQRKKQAEAAREALRKAGV